jgi:hypothetical protein
MIVIAAAALVMVAVRFIVWVSPALGIGFLVLVAVFATAKFVIPIAFIVEFLFFAFYLWFRPKPSGEIARTARSATLKPSLSVGRKQL